MKEHTEIISESIFNHFSTTQTRKAQTHFSYNRIQSRFFAWKEQLQNGVATLGIGTVLLITIYLFFTQLAEYGWQ